MPHNRPSPIPRTRSLVIQQPRSWLRIPYIAERLRKPPQTVYNWRQGSTKYKPLPAFQLGKGSPVRINEADLMHWLWTYRSDLLDLWMSGRA
jgi:hypothetical protein